MLPRLLTLVIQDHAPTQKFAFWYAFCFGYNMRKSVRRRSTVLLRHVMNFGRICANYIRINKSSYLGFSSNCLPVITQRLSCFHCLQASMWETTMLVFVEVSVTLTHRFFSPYKYLSIHSLQPWHHESVPHGSGQSGETFSV